MFIYYAFAILASFIAGIVIAVRSKKAEGVVYGVLDKIGIVTNVLLIPIYSILTLFFLFIVMLGMNPGGEGFMFVLSLIVSAIGSTAPAAWGVGLGASIALRRKGKSKKSFLVQFVGIAGFAIVLLFFFLFYGNLFDSLN